MNTPLAGGRILIVEDEQHIADGLRFNLEAEGLDTVVASDGERALHLLLKERQPFDAVILDVMLPGKDGFDVCRELRRSGMTAPIIMLTARTQEAEKVLAFESGADDYVTKPFGPRELRARIAAHLRRSKPAAPSTTVQIGDVEIDFDRGEIRRGSTSVALTPLEFRLLQLFVRAQGRILTRDQLIDGAWGPGTSVSDRVVDNHIGSLRRKIEPEATEPRYLKNVRGLGYRFEV